MNDIMMRNLCPVKRPNNKQYVEYYVAYHDAMDAAFANWSSEDEKRDPYGFATVRNVTEEIKTIHGEFCYECGAPV